MKILGFTTKSDYSPVYLAEISLDEINKVMHNANGRKISALSIGETVHMGVGYNFKRDIESVCASVIETNKEFLRTHQTLQSFAEMVIKNKSEAAGIDPQWVEGK